MHRLLVCALLVACNNDDNDKRLYGDFDATTEKLLHDIEGPKYDPLKDVDAPSPISETKLTCGPDYLELTLDTRKQLLAVTTSHNDYENNSSFVTKATLAGKLIYETTLPDRFVADGGPDFTLRYPMLGLAPGTALAGELKFQMRIAHRTGKTDRDISGRLVEEFRWEKAPPAVFTVSIKLPEKLATSGDVLTAKVHLASIESTIEHYLEDRIAYAKKDGGPAAKRMLATVDKLLERRAELKKAVEGAADPTVELTCGKVAAK